MAENRIPILRFTSKITKKGNVFGLTIPKKDVENLNLEDKPVAIEIYTIEEVDDK